MAGYNLSETVTAGQPGHISHTNSVHDIVNKFDKDATPAAGNALVWDGTVYVPDNLLDGPVAIGAGQTVDPRVPFKSSHVITASATPGTSHSGHLLQTIASGNWAADTTADAGWAWGLEVYTTTGTTAGDADNMAVLHNHIEVGVRAPAGTDIGVVMGLKVEAAFETATAAATIGEMRSLSVTPPWRKTGATGGTVTGNAYGLYISTPDSGATSIGAAINYAMFVQGGLSRFEGTVSLQQATASSALHSLTVRAGTTQTGSLIRFEDSGGGAVGRVTVSGLIAGSGRGVFREGQASQTSVGDVGPSSAAGITFGSASDMTLFRIAAGSFGWAAGTVPADAALSTNQIALWYDGSSGAAKLMIKAKDAGGIVRTGQVALT